MAQSLWKIVSKMVWKISVSCKTNIVLLYDPAITLLGIYTMDLKTYIHAESYT